MKGGREGGREGTYQGHDIQLRDEASGSFDEREGGK